MKQRISPNQVLALTDKQKSKLPLIKKGDMFVVIYENNLIKQYLCSDITRLGLVYYRLDINSGKNKRTIIQQDSGLPLLTIGQLIELLHNSKNDNFTHFSIFKDRAIVSRYDIDVENLDYEETELIDALWQAFVEVCLKEDDHV